MSHAGSDTSRPRGTGSAPQGAPGRRALIRWSFSFFLCNALALAVIGLRYLAHHPGPAQPLAQLYTLLAYVSHFALLGLLPWFCVALPLALLLPRRRLVVGVSVLLCAASLAILLVDSLVFDSDRFHLSALSLQILGRRTWGFAALYFVIFLAFAAMLAGWTWRRFSGSARRPLRVWLGAGLAAAFLATQALHAWADAAYYVPITSFTAFLPGFHPWQAERLLARLGLVDPARIRDALLQDALETPRGGLLHYPLAALECSPPPAPYNVLIVGLDAMRRDMNNATVAPRIWRFSQGAIQFERHYSGGNATRTGLFSLFYGVPATYWREVYAEQKSPVLIDELQHQGYQFGIFAGNPPNEIVGLDRTAFRNLPDLPQVSGDDKIAAAWIDWLARRDPQRPFFGFVFFESAPGGCRPEYPQIARAAEGASRQEQRFACYQVALHHADALAGELLDDLERRDLLDHTVVIVTSDHGEEFDENGLGFQAHGTAYSSYQLHTPMVVHWPGRPAGSVERRTSHHDVAPTLLTELLGCRNPPSDYGSGSSLFGGREWPWLVAASYTGFAVVEPDQVTISSGSSFEIRDSSYRILEHPILQRDVISQAIRETSRFYRR